MNALFAVLWKDLVSEWRSRDRLVAMGVFALLVVIVLYLAAPGARREPTSPASSGSPTCSRACSA